MGHVACISGADRGLGYGICKLLLKLEWRVFAGQYMPEWPALDVLCGEYADRLQILPLDVSREESVREAAKTVAGLVTGIDLLINNAGVSSPTGRATIREPQDYSEMHRLFNVNTLGALRIVDAFLPLMDHGEMKRLCFVSSEAGSIERSAREAGYGYTMSKAALNMGVKLLFNHLRPSGYTFRLYHPGWIRSYMGGTKSTRGDMEPEQAAEYAVAYFLDDLTLDPADTQTNPEDRLILRDWLRNEWPW